MPLRLTDTILGPPRVSLAMLDFLISKLREPDDKDRTFLQRLVYWCAIAGIDDGDAIAQWLLETANGESDRWNRDTDGDGFIDLNPGGVGIPSNSTVQPFRIASPDEAARILVQVLYSAATGKLHPGVPVPAAAQPWFDKVWLPKVTAKRYPRVKTIDDLDVRYPDASGEMQAAYAWDGDDDGDPAYAPKVVARGNLFLPDLPDQSQPNQGGPPVSTPTTKIVFGRLPLPEKLELHDIVSNGPNTAFDRLGARLLLGAVTHRMIGTLLGTNGYFQGEAAARSLTDFGIGGSWDKTLAGTIYQWIPKGLAIAPWASGPANDLEGDGVAFVQALGPNAVNRDLRAIELSDGGNQLNPWGEQEQPAQWASYIALMAYLFDQAEVPWDQYPFNPNVNLITDLEHWEIGPKDCPFAPVREKVTQRQAAIRALLKMFQTGVGTTPVPIPPVKPIPKSVPYSATLDQAFLREVWGNPRRVYRDGSAAKDDQGQTKHYPWNPKWTPCSAWINRAKTEKEFPTPGDWESMKTDGGPVSMIPFSNGWVLFHFDDERGWRWAGDETKKTS